MSPLLEYSEEGCEEQLKVFEMRRCSLAELAAEMQWLVGLELSQSHCSQVSKFGHIESLCSGGASRLMDSLSDVSNLKLWHHTPVGEFLRIYWCRLCVTLAFISSMNVYLFLKCYLSRFISTVVYVLHLSVLCSYEIFCCFWTCFQSWYQMLWIVVYWCTDSQFQTH